MNMRCRRRERTRAHSVLCLVGMLFAASTHQQADARAQPASDGKPPSSLTVPIYYVTDREQKGCKFGPNRKYQLECKHDPFYGKVSITVANERHKNVNNSLTQIGWHNCRRSFFKRLEMDPINDQDPERAKSSFLADLQNVLNESGSNELFVFVHGCNNTFDSAAGKAARLAYFAEAPVIMYSWPSIGKLSYYRVDEDNIGWSAEHFAHFLSDLQQLKASSPIKVVLVLHSLAVRIINWEFEGTSKTKLFQEVALVCPDIDSETFKHFMAHFADDRTRLRLYVSRKDRALPLVQMFNGGYYRLGEGVGNFFSLFGGGPRQALASTAQWLKKPVLGINLSDETPESYTVATNKQTQIIDYTLLDHGFWGHSVPYELVANMTRTGNPGQDLELTPSALSAGNFMTRLIRWSYNFGPPPAGTLGTCQRVVRRGER